MKVLSTTETSYHLEKLVKEANEKLTIVSPYLKINKLLRVSLEDAFKRCSEVNFVFRTNQLNFSEKNGSKNSSMSI